MVVVCSTVKNGVRWRGRADDGVTESMVIWVAEEGADSGKNTRKITDEDIRRSYPTECT